MTRAPLRFLIAVLALWVGVRAAILLPDWSGGLALLPEAAAAAPPAPIAAAPPPVRTAAADSVAATLPGPAVGRSVRRDLPRQIPPAVLRADDPNTHASLPFPQQDISRLVRAAAVQSPVFSLPALRPAAPAASRWSVSAWLLVRDDSGSPALAPGGTLGGSQAGARIVYALGGGLSLSARAYLPLRQTAGAELAAGIDWQPLPTLPVHLLAERRQRLGRDGRNAVALTLYGGVSRSLEPRLRLDAYGQAGAVGLRSRDLFADGAVSLSRRIGPVELGAGAWGAAQPGTARLDAGPSLAWRLPVAGGSLRLQADWRFRVAGDAAPRSGPALTLAGDF